MDSAKKMRTVQRMSFTKSHNNFMEKTTQPNFNMDEVQVAYELLGTRMGELESSNAKYVNLLLETETTEAEIQADMETHETYVRQFFNARVKYGKLTERPQIQNTANIASHVTQVEKPFKRPTLELPKFDGNVSSWLQFISHFQKIHDDPNIPNEDKLAYLKQSMEKGSKAEGVIQGYPTTRDNYVKAFESLKNRFGRDELLIEYYTRELLSLVLQNVANKGKKVSVSSIYDKVSAHIRALDTLGVKTKECAIMLYPLVESSLPEEILRTWQRSTVDRGTAEGADAADSTDRLSKLLNFLEAEVENEERILMAVNGFSLGPLPDKKSKEVKTKTNSTPDPPSAFSLVSSEGKVKLCVFCGEEHENASCEKAKKLTIEERKSTLKENRCCFKCLKRGHLSKNCRVKITCVWCNGRHSILVCTLLEAKNDANNSKSDSTNSCGPTNNEQNLSSFCNYPDVCLQTLQVVLYSESREKVVRALCDSGWQRTYISSKAAEFLGYQPLDQRETVHTLFGGVSSSKQTHNVYSVRARNLSNSYACNFQAMNQNNICGEIPSIKKDAWMNELKRKNILLTDVNNGKVAESPIELLIGADILGKIMTGKKVTLSNGLTAFETKLGWTLMGKIPAHEHQDTATEVISMHVSEAKIEDLWNLDVLGIRDPSEKLDRIQKEKIIKENFIKTVSFSENKRYSVDLPWIDDHAPVANTLELAKRRLENTVKKLKANGLYDAYDKVFSEWLEENIIELVPETKSDLFAHYLPHRPVIKDNSTTKIRPVFDASASVKNYPSLNECLDKGPNLIELIPASLLRFRENEIAVIADVRKAFLQIEVNSKDRDFLRFMWYHEGRLRIFRHNRVVFGLTCSPFLLGAVLEYHFERVLNAEIPLENCNKEIVEKLKQSFYVDNCVTSVKSVDELNLFMSTAKEVMSAGGFDLRGWEFTGDRDEKDTTLVLGILFNKTRDTILINPAILQCKPGELINKRLILSFAHKLFDPVGFTSPVTLLPKLILKRLVESKIGWDAPVDKETRDEFLTWHEQLKFLSEIEISRGLGSGKFSIHTFCDASTIAYAAVTFLRVENDGNVELKFLTAKAKIAPKNITVPRLELLATLIGSRQTREILDTLEYKDVPIFYWSDSTTALTWIKKDLQWGTFIWNRVQEIRRLTEGGHWRYVTGELNPADLPSRGCQAKKLVESRWWEGPQWLRKSSLDWPNLKGSVDTNVINSELKRSAETALVNVGKKEEEKTIDFSKMFSSYDKMLRFFAIVFRFYKFKYKDERKFTRYLSYKEIRDVEIKYLKSLQREMFVSLEDPKLRTLQVFVHTDGLIRLKTKIIEREDSFFFLYPVVLDRHHGVIKLLIRETHEKMGHAGVQTVMCHLREKFWILQMRREIQSIIFKCVTCKRNSVKPMQAISAPLPRDRVRDTEVFEITGVDFAGPVFLRNKEKAWICLFTCAVYRAVHLELMTSLSTPEFLNGFRRFIGRRGRPSIVYSDNGTNFVGANNAFKGLNWNVISSYSSARCIEWRFNPPSAPWWGGWWERLIGMMKQLLKKILGKSCLTYEEMLTVLCDCEMTLNSRPLTYLSDQCNELKPLTPSMFIHGIRISETPDLDALDRVNLNSRYKHKQEVIEHLRTRFRKEYLGQLISRDCVKERRQIKEGDIVLLGDDSHKRLDWPLARIEKLILGRDGVARVAILKTKDGVYNRPIQRIYPLEINNSEECVLLRDIADNKELVIPSEQVTASDCNTNRIKTRSGREIKAPKIFQ